MEREQQDTLLYFASAALGFAVRHPYAASGIVGAAVGSVATYSAMTYQNQRQKVTKVFTPKVYDLELPPEDLQMLIENPSAKLRLEAAEVTVVISAEKREPLRQLPDIDGTSVIVD